MHRLAAALACLLAAAAQAQHAAPPAEEGWSNPLPASDDRYTNPASPVYAGPNGWFNSGRVLAVVGDGAKRYDYKAGFNETSGSYAATESGTLHLVDFDFGGQRPADGNWTAAAKADAALRQVRVEFSDSADGLQLVWSSGDAGGAVTVVTVGDFIYVRCRSLRLQPAGSSNTGAAAQPMSLGFEGAVKP